MNYLAYKYKPELLGADLKAQALHDNLYNVLVDLGKKARPHAFQEDHEAKKPALVEGLRPKLALISKFAGDNTFLTGESITLADFFAFELFEVFDVIGKEILDEYKNLRDFKDRFASQEWYKSYCESDRHIKALFPPQYAKINNV